MPVEADGDHGIVGGDNQVVETNQFPSRRVAGPECQKKQSKAIVNIQSTMSDNTARMNLEQSESKGAVRLPFGNYKLRIVEEPKYQLSKQKPGKPQYPMLVWQFEVAEPGEVVVDGVVSKVSGLTIRHWTVIFENDDGTETCKDLAAIHSQAGLPTNIGRDRESGLPVDDNGIPITYVGTVIDAKCGCQEYIETDEATGEQLTNPRTGEVLKGYRYEVKRIY